MEMHLIATIRDAKNDIAGFRILDLDNGQITDQDRNKVEYVLSNNIAPIIGMEYINGEIKGTNGSLARYPKLNTCKKPMSNEIVILGQFNNGDLGYLVANIKGQTIVGSKKDIVAKAKYIGIANGKIVTNNNGEDYLSAINGTYAELDPVKYNVKVEVEKQDDEKIKLLQAHDTFGNKTSEIEEENKKSDEETMKNIAKQALAKMGSIRGASLRRFVYGHTVTSKDSHLKDVVGVRDGNNITVEDKLLSIFIGMKNTKPLYYAILVHLARKESDDLSTMAVSNNTLYFSGEFIKEKPIHELTFAVFHELCHIAMQHHVRCQNRNTKIWNYATDLFINKTIYEEFQLHGLEVSTFNNRGEKITAGTKYLSIALPDWVLFSDVVDTKKDTAESIYDELMQSNQDNQKQKNGDGQDNGEQSDSQQSQNNGSGGGQSDQDNKSNNGNDNEQDNNSDSQSDNGSKSNENEGNGNSQGGDNSSEGDVNGSSSGGSSGGSSGNKSGKDKQKKKIKFRGQELEVPDEIDQDMVDDNESRGKTNDQLRQESKSILHRATQTLRQNNQYNRSGSSDLLRQIEMELAPKIDWRNLIKNYLVKSSQRINTFSSPDKRYRALGMIIPGPKALEPDALDNVKICIDTSGSVGDEEIGQIYTQVHSLLSRYKADAEIIFWDTEVKSATRLKEYRNAQELIKIKPVGCGGTDPGCVFRYFNTERDYKIGRRPKPQLILMFTDGYFSESDVMEYSKKYKNVIWVIHDNDEFKAPFGQVAPLKVEN